MIPISPQELKKKIDSKEDFELVDVLSKDSYEVKHIPGAKNIPLAELGRRAETELPDKTLRETQTLRHTHTHTH